LYINTDFHPFKKKNTDFHNKKILLLAKKNKK
jgi:hypothetical protein